MHARASPASRRDERRRLWLPGEALVELEGRCRLCEEACPQRVICFNPEFDARDLMRLEARAITDIRLHPCEICGETLPARVGRFCITCQRRGRVESHVPKAVARVG